MNLLAVLSEIPDPEIPVINIVELGIVREAKMLSENDETGAVTGRQAFIYALALLAVSLLPSVFFDYSAIYFYGALLLGAGFASMAANFAVSGGSIPAARWLFLGSIAYLPLLLGLMVLAR